MTLGFGSPRGTRLTTTAKYSLTDFKKQLAAPPNLATSTVGAKLSRALSRTSAVSAGYEYSIAETGVGVITKSHRATMGVAYTPPLSVTRRAMFRIDVSTSVFESPASAPTGFAPTATARRLYPLQGEAGVEYPFRLKWRAGASYRRSVDNLPGLSGPMVANGARINLNGVIGRRVDVSVSGLYASTQSALVPGANHFGTYSGEARVRYALSRTFAVYSEYFHYSYDFSEDAPQARAASPAFTSSAASGWGSRSSVNRSDKKAGTAEVSVRKYSLNDIASVIAQRRWLILVPFAFGIAHRTAPRALCPRTLSLRGVDCRDSAAGARQLRASRR